MDAVSEVRGQRVVIVGQGYVGLPLAMRLVEVGHDVVGYDVDESRVKRLAAAESYVEDVSDPQLQSALDSGRFHPTAAGRDCAGFDVAPPAGFDVGSIFLVTTESAIAV